MLPRRLKDFFIQNTFSFKILFHSKYSKNHRSCYNYTMSLNGPHHLQDQGTNPNQSQLIARFNVSLKKLVSYQEEGFYVQNESP